MAQIDASSEKTSRINDLRNQLRRLEQGGAEPRPAVALGPPEIDAALEGGLPTGCLHEILGSAQDGAATGFCLAVLSRLMRPGGAGGARPVLWCARHIDLYGPGLAAWGIDPGRLILVETAKPADLLWTMEEGLRCAGLMAVVGEIDRLDLTAGRRLQLAAEAGGVTGLVLRHSAWTRADGASATTSRWRVSTRPRIGPGPACWRVELLRYRGGRPRDWQVEWRDETGTLALAAAFRDGQVEAQATG
ncbi:MAG: ImuA family protein [Rhodanobacter sp.]